MSKAPWIKAFMMVRPSLAYAPGSESVDWFQRQGNRKDAEKPCPACRFLFEPLIIDRHSSDCRRTIHRAVDNLLDNSVDTGGKLANHDVFYRIAHC
ncbi:MAG: hypothetical protein JW884_13370 [Deltaproteobacteria bacterium]|nr:hypothetical protein [Deltaproteobacteria bacterium]